MEVSPEPTVQILEYSRFWVQRVLVPIMFCVGVPGNIATVMVLTRRRMRSSTNTYLSALAIADIIHLLSVLLLSFKHYSNIHEKRYELYWRFLGFTYWLCDAASSTSVWLTVSFTLERYIAVCHPIKGKVLCTENRAKSVIVIVSLVCILTTASTTFEYQLDFKEECIKTCELSKLQTTGNLFHNGTTIHHYISNHPNIAPDQLSPNHSSISLLNDVYIKSSLNKILSNCTSHPHIIYIPYYSITTNNTNKKMSNNNLIANQVINSKDTSIIANVQKEEVSSQENVLEKPPNKNDFDVHTDGLIADNLVVVNQNETLSPVENETLVIDNVTCCLHNISIDTEFTNLGKNEIYRNIMNWYSSIIFWLIPLILIATFNCLLVKAVYESQKRRRKMTNTQENISLSNENRITLMLIGVVILFLIFQTPTGIFLIYNSFQGNKKTTERVYNIKLILGNVFNFLMMVNASCNFLLYCGFSKKFRSTFKKLFFEWRKKRQDTIALSTTKSRNSQRFNPLKHGIRRNASEYHTPRNLETQSLTSMPRSKSLVMRPPGKAKSSDLNV